ncbi:plasma kallikrein-like [Anneissia japonica]|uniref:plasma kallikrein-like n=1 Tax=Anneissia japonica TaxID=1529436 RepID=UPI001425A9DA|nr:plasma kallikrein-like [Anneissia japonica]
MRLLLVVFTFHLLRTCESVKRCSMPERPENGNFYFTTRRENKIGGFVKFTCDPGYDLNGQKKIKCLKSTKNWATKFPTCEIEDFSQCGISGGIGGSNLQRSRRVVGGADARPGAWPWQVAFYDNAQNFFCGGSLISNEWILTAANCFDQDPGPMSVRGKDWKTTTPYMGLTNRATDRKSSNTSRIIDFIMHPLYNTKESPIFDYDVALAKIEPIKLHPQVRTVCLPGVTDTNLQEEYSLEWKPNQKDYVTVTGWGRLGFNREKAAKLQQLDLPLGVHDKCRKSLGLAGDEFTHQMFCAGGEAGKDSCAGDAGGPVVQKRTNNGEERYEVVGIVSWGKVDCGQEGEYGFYTHVPRLLDWIKNTTGLE